MLNIIILNCPPKKKPNKQKSLACYHFILAQ